MTVTVINQTRKPSRRALLEASIEAAIALLDNIDGDCDFEDGGDDEPDHRGLFSLPSAD